MSKSFPKSRSGVSNSLLILGVEYKSVSAACVSLGKNYEKTKRRLQRGWSTEQAFDLCETPREVTAKERDCVAEETLNNDGKICKECGEFKPLSGFPVHKTCRDGHAPVCRVCKTSKTRLSRYGVSRNEYERMAKEQGYKCKICGSKDPKTRMGSLDDLRYKFCVDHCHETGVVRGLLCMQCNVGLGKFSDSIGNLESAIKYIRESKLK